MLSNGLGNDRVGHEMRIAQRMHVAGGTGEGCRHFQQSNPLRGLDPSKVKGHLAAWNYFQSVDTPENKEFVKKFQAKYGKDRVTDDPIEAAYIGVYFWKMAVEKAKSTDVDKVREALRTGIEFDAPEGKIKLDPKTQHVYKYFRLGQILDTKQFKIIFETPETGIARVLLPSRVIVLSSARRVPACRSPGRWWR